MSDEEHKACGAGSGHWKTAAELLPVVYDELRRLAAAKLAHEPAGHSLDATALVHEAYLRLIGKAPHTDFANRAHFFAAAADAMRRILVDHARHKRALKRGGRVGPACADPAHIPGPAADEDSWIDLDWALTSFKEVDASAAELANLRIFGGLSVEEAADALQLSRASAYRMWTYARAWLTTALTDLSLET